VASRTVRYRGHELDILALSAPGAGWLVMIWTPGKKNPTVMPSNASEVRAIEAAHDAVDEMLDGSRTQE
jgi:hypothetical protein